MVHKTYWCINLHAKYGNIYQIPTDLLGSSVFIIAWKTIYPESEDLFALRDYNYCQVVWLVFDLSYWGAITDMHFDYENWIPWVFNSFLHGVFIIFRATNLSSVMLH